jgi:hypothetical protein
MKSERAIRKELKMVRQSKKGGPVWMAIIQTLSWVLNEQDGNVMSPAEYVKLGKGR